MVPKYAASSFKIEKKILCKHFSQSDLPQLAVLHIKVEKNVQLTHTHYHLSSSNSVACWGGCAHTDLYNVMTFRLLIDFWESKM